MLDGAEVIMRTRAEQIADIKADQQFWRELAAEVGPDRYGEPGPMGAWSFGDMAGHLAGWRNRTIARLEALARGGRRQGDGGADACPAGSQPR